jgi:hypothetical protein
MIFCDHSPFSQIVSVSKMFHLEPSPRSIEEIVLITLDVVDRTKKIKIKT